mmetsp:Transcript_34641/g.83120  ORF Transcript_34641/g.83120 Transcript_34641/m.83120 type:complete len:240 (+) Transcript_34641:8337-9056(+)
MAPETSSTAAVPVVSICLGWLKSCLIRRIDLASTSSATACILRIQESKRPRPLKLQRSAIWAKVVGTCTWPAAKGWHPTTRSNQKISARRYASFSETDKKNSGPRSNVSARGRSNLKAPETSSRASQPWLGSSQWNWFCVSRMVCRISCSAVTVARVSAKSPELATQLAKLATSFLAPATQLTGNRPCTGGRPTRFHIRMVSGVLSFSFFTTAEYCRKSWKSLANASRVAGFCHAPSSQ